MVENERIRILGTDHINNKGKYIVYFVQTAPRVKYNQALNFATEQANVLNLPLVCYFELSINFPSVNNRNITFLLQGLSDFEKNLKNLGIKLVIGNSDNTNKILSNSNQVITDRGYLKFHKSREEYLKKLNLKVTSIETNVIVPVETASNKQEYSAFLFRKKIEPLVSKYLVVKKQLKPKLNSLNLTFESIDILNIKNVLNFYKVDNSVLPIKLTGGEAEAEKHLKLFITDNLKNYEEFRNDPTLNFQSNLSPYLHFGHISPIKIALECLKENDKDNKNIQSFFNELVIWRELAKNFCFYNNNYDNFEGLPNWAKENLNKHNKDNREFIYTKKQFEEAKTHDKYWNAAQNQILTSGKIHGYMRMYWGKKVIEWTKTPQQAYEILVYLNDKYSIDGRDENGYAGIGWCFGLHDRPHFKHKVLGNIRYMAESGLKKKFDAEKYVQQNP